MVHALNEAWRVLVPHGIMVDVRPLSVDIALEVVYEGGSEAAGVVDMSPDLKYDLASDKAIEVVMKQGRFALASLDTFNYCCYWNTFHGMMVDFKEWWKDEIIVSAEVVEKARRLYRQKRAKTQLRLPMKMKLGKYIKQG